MKQKIAVVRGKFLNKYELQFYEPLVSEFDMTAFGSLYPYHDRFSFPVVKFPSPMDVPDFPYKMPVLNRLFTDAHYLFGLEEKLKGFDLVHTAETYFHYTQQCLNAKKKGYVKKVIATVLENIPFNNEGIHGRKAFKKRARTELDHMIALTEKSKAALLQEGADESKITVISHFIDTKRFKPVRVNKTNSLTILFSGRLEEYKGVLDILQAAQILRNDAELKKYTLQYIFAGNGSLKQKMLSEEQRLGLSNVVTHVQSSYDDMPSIYNSADIFVAPSKPTPTYDEQYCTALLEAQASGLPIVTTNTGGIPENIGEAGILVAPGDIAEIAHALKTFILNPSKRKTYALQARKRAITVHDISIGASKLSALYRRLLS
jgi:glycosyltransferase involved in cell wall biosynthesis